MTSMVLMTSEMFGQFAGSKAKTKKKNAGGAAAPAKSTASDDSQPSCSFWSIAEPRRKRNLKTVPKDDTVDTKRRKMETDDGNGSEPADETDETMSMKPVLVKGSGIGPYASEWYRDTVIPLGMFKNRDLKADDGQGASEAAALIVADMTQHFNQGLVIPPNAERDWKGWFFTMLVCCFNQTICVNDDH